MNGRICLITGANSGHGLAVAMALARMGATVIAGCRNPERGEAARRVIVSQAGNDRVFSVTLDVSSKESILHAADQVMSKFGTLDVLVNNAGAWWADRRISTDGIELVWATNVVGPFLLTRLLLPALRLSDDGRIINIASSYAGGLDLEDVEWRRRPYNGIHAYQASKQALRMLTWTLAEEIEGTTLKANAICPGFMRTCLGRSAPAGFRLMLWLTKPLQTTPERGADTAIWLASSRDAAETNQFFVKRKPTPCSFRDPIGRQRLHRICLDLTGV